jgi:hypothetical protein
VGRNGPLPPVGQRHNHVEAAVGSKDPLLLDEAMGGALKG